MYYLDCDHACGLHQVADAKRILVSEEEMRYANSIFPDIFGYPNHVSKYLFKY